jgi:hypothetical protein
MHFSNNMVNPVGQAWGIITAGKWQRLRAIDMSREAPLMTRIQP